LRDNSQAIRFLYLYYIIFVDWLSNLGILKGYPGGWWIKFEKFNSGIVVCRARNFNRYKFIDFPKPHPGIDKFLSIAWLVGANLIRTDACECPPLTHKTGQNGLKIKTIKIKLFSILLLTFLFYLL